MQVVIERVVEITDDNTVNDYDMSQLGVGYTWE